MRIFPDDDLKRKLLHTMGLLYGKHKTHPSDQHDPVHVDHHDLRQGYGVSIVMVCCLVCSFLHISVIPS